MTAVEAARRGIPVVAAKRGALPEILDHNRTGLLFKPEDPTDLAANLEDIIRRPEMSRSLAEAACEEVQLRFNEQKMISEFEKLFNSRVDSSLPSLQL